MEVVQMEMTQVFVNNDGVLEIPEPKPENLCLRCDQPFKVGDRLELVVTNSAPDSMAMKFVHKACL